MCTDIVEKKSIFWSSWASLFEWFVASTNVDYIGQKWITERRYKIWLLCQVKYGSKMVFVAYDDATACESEHRPMVGGFRWSIQY